MCRAMLLTICMLLTPCTCAIFAWARLYTQVSAHFPCIRRCDNIFIVTLQTSFSVNIVFTVPTTATIVFVCYSAHHQQNPPLYSTGRGAILHEELVRPQLAPSNVTWWFSRGPMTLCSTYKHLPGVIARAPMPRYTEHSRLVTSRIPGGIPVCESIAWMTGLRSLDLHVHVRQLRL